jgi:ssRNA-specific RNase YbeY (16S rRNA maturation enzyme)
MREVTLRSKKKDKVSNVLAFPLSKTSGEILICPAAARPYTLDYLFIHGCLHLKGMDHGGRMNSAEQDLLKRFVR